MSKDERGELLVGLDIGSTKIGVVVAEVKNQQVKIVGVGRSPSVGLRRGVVVNIESTVNSIRQAVEEAEQMANCEIGSVFVGIAGNHIKGFNSHGLVPIRSGEVRQEDIDRAIDAARAVAIPHGQEIIHVLPQEFTVDGQPEIQDPIGMTGVRLEVEVHIVTGATTAIHNIVRCCKRAGLNVIDVVLEPLASAEAVLTREEIELGVGLLDIGGGTSDLAIFAGGSIKHTFVLGLGGNNLTNDLSVGLRTPFKEAERLKEQFGCSLSSLIDQDQIIDVPSVGGRRSRRLSRRVMGDILEPRMEEILTLINHELSNSRYRELVNAGLVLTGGTALLEHLEKLVEHIFDLPVRVGVPENIEGHNDLVNSPQWATGVGLVIYGTRCGTANGFRAGSGKRFARLGSRMRDWFKRL